MCYDTAKSVETMWTIYALMEPIPLLDAGSVRYVGFTSGLVLKRLIGHMREARSVDPNYDSHKNRWLRQLLGCGLHPSHIVLETGDDMDLWADAEKKWIAQFRALGARLTNATDGGDGTPGRAHSPETKAKIGARTRVAQRGRKHTAGTLAKMSESAKARWAKPAQREKLCAALRTRRKQRPYVRTPRSVHRSLSPAEKEKLNAGRRALWADPEHRARMSGANHPRAKLSSAQVVEIREAAARGERHSAIARRFGVSQTQIGVIVRGKARRSG
jgi:hypothetical protein